MSRIFASAKALLRNARLRELLRWCLPALILALVLRVVLSVHMPFAYFHDDAPDFLTTPDRLIHEHKFELHEKKTFLVPVLFTLPFALPMPAMVTIPLAQHALGLGLIVLIGALCRLWFASWKVFILPLTILAAINPFFIWYEHTLMAETIFVVCTALVALAGTLYAREQTLERFVALCVALVLEAGARPEGKLLFGFGLLLVVLLHARELRAAWRRPAIVIVVALLSHLATKTSQAGLLLYTSVARLTPAALSCAPGFDPYIAPIRANLQTRWDARPQFPRVRDRKAIAEAVERYLKDDASRGQAKRQSDVNKFCLKLARETCLRNLAALPGLAWTKFRLVATESPAAQASSDGTRSRATGFDNALLFDKQREALTDSLDRTLRLSHGLFGTEMKTEPELQRWIDTHYGEVPWFNRLSDGWLATVNAWRLADARYSNPDFPTAPVTYYGVPFYFLLAAAGVLVAMLRLDLRVFHVTWGLTLIGFLFTIMLTANVRPRFRFVFEPFWFLYAALLAESLWLGARRLIRR
ncbi:MAG: hypothetical protein ABMA13_17800 [Chthoniobacteraceae bacterium]